jgi:hypothetical protein
MITETPDKSRHKATITKKLREQIASYAGSDKVFLELGCDVGYTSIALADSFGKLHAYDIERWKIEECRKNASKFNKANIEFHNKKTTDISTGHYDVILIDANHEYKNVKRDYEAALSANTSNDYIVIFHDYGLVEAGVKKFVQEIGGYELIGEKENWNPHGGKVNDYEAAIVKVKKKIEVVTDGGPKIFVGTAYSCENEFDECVKRINSQEQVTIVEHKIVSGQGVLEALSALYSRWNELKTECDMFVQVDADMVIKRNDLFKCAWQQFKHNTQGCNYMQLTVYDHFTMSEIGGMNFYRPSVVFPQPKNRLGPDKETLDKKQLRNSNNLISSAADHCPNPNEIQSFHYGWHRRLRQKYEIENSIQNAVKRHKTDKLVDMRIWALLGIKFAAAHAKSKIENKLEHVDYSNQHFMNAFEEAKSQFDSFKKEKLK